ncbi:MAG: hypothetical protein J6Y08_00030 [Clostridiales bacterium]|nr:hypothetical protein [Clostridiales bacterium]
MIGSGGMPGSIRNALLYGNFQSATSLFEKRRGYANHEEDIAKRPLVAIKDPSYLELVRIALCYHIAKVDGVSEDEMQIIDEMCRELLNNPNGGSQFRVELNMILSDRGTDFESLKRYLVRIEPDVLEAFKDDMIQIADTTDGITENERNAINMFQEFVDERKKVVGEKPKEEVPVEASVATETEKPIIICGVCGAQMEIDGDTAFCNECGYVRPVNK